MSFFRAQDLRALAENDLTPLQKSVQATKEINEIFGTILKEAYRSVSLDQDFDIFMSHRAIDAKALDGLRKKIANLGYSIYIDWEIDIELDRSNVTKQNARALKTRMDHSRCLFYATTANSSNSKWMPWELGYFDGKKNGRVAILPVLEPLQPEAFRGIEYLGLYNYVDIEEATNDGLQLWINESSSRYVAFDDWLEGNEPRERS